MHLERDRTMYRAPAKLFKVVSDPDGRYGVWFADAPPQAPWQDAGQVGAEDECWDYVEAAESSEGFLFNFETGS